MKKIFGVQTSYKSGCEDLVSAFNFAEFITKSNKSSSILRCCSAVGLLLALGVTPASAAQEINLPKDNIKLESSVKQDDVNASASEEDLSIKREFPEFLNIVREEGLTLESGIVKNIKIKGYYDGSLTMDRPDDGNLSSRYSFPAAELTIQTKFRDNKTSLNVAYNFTRNIKGHTNEFTERLSEVAIIRKLGEHNELHLGQSRRLPIGVEGGVSAFRQDMVSRAMIGRNFGNTRSLGARVIGNYDVVDYDIGVYDSTRYMQDFFHGAEFTGWVNARPLAKLANSKKYGKVTVGTGCNVGKYLNDYKVWGAYIGYDYKKFHNKFEYAVADGYNGSVNSSNKAQGFYNTVLYDLTPKVQLVGRYDFYDPNTKVNSNSITEYTVGVNYSLTKKVRLMVNYGYKHNQKGPNANLIMLGTKVLLN